MILRLSRLPADKVTGCYDGNKNGRVDDPLPSRMRFIHPDAYNGFLQIAPFLVISDLFRSPESSLAAVRAGRGARLPGYSGHNYGLSVDINVREAMKKLNVRTKQGLDDCMRFQGWWCHRVDGQITALKGESHHYNYLGRDFALPDRAKSTAPSIEERIVELYGDRFVLNVDQQQAYLRDTGLYRGEVDGDAGPLTREAIRAFQRTWNLPATGKADAKTQRTLAYVTATVEEVTL